MQFSKQVAALARTHGVEPKDVFFALLATSGIAAIGESFAIVYRPTVSTSSALTTKASNFIGQRPGLKRLIKYLDEQHQTATTDDETTTKPTKRGRPKKADDTPADDNPELDYTDKDAVLKELARIAGRCEKESDRLAAIREISSLQRMKQEAAVEDDKRVVYYIPLTYSRCDELLSYLAKYYQNAPLTDGKNNAQLPPSG